jgi:hypothetical protein
MKKAGIVLAALLVAAIAGNAAAAPAEKVYYEKPYGQIAYKPKRIDFSSTVLKKLKWRHWNSKVARGKGRARVNDCIPNCGQGTIHAGRARLKMFKRHAEGDRLMYGCMTGTVRADGQKYPVEWPVACSR